MMKNGASWHASEAIKYDVMGATGMAIRHYTMAVRHLGELIGTNEHPKLQFIHMGRRDAMLERIHRLWKEKWRA